jgi:outer membrane protein assembly factor BamB
MNSASIVFVCGTYSDLSEERGAVLDAIQRLQLQRGSMEFFGARPERSIRTCLEEVHKSDILVVIVGHLYGTLVPELGISYSEAEYAEGYRLGKPCLVYIRDENIPILPRQMEQNPDKVQLLNRWKAELRERHTVFRFRQSNDLAVQVTADLARSIRKLEQANGARETASEPGTPPRREQRGGRDAAVAVRYCQRFGDPARQLLHGLTTDQQGNIIVIGDFWGSFDFGGPKLTSRGDRSIFIAKFDRTGNHVWSRSFGDESEKVGVGVGTDANGAVFIASAFTGTLDFGGKPLVSAGRYNIALAKIDPTGRHLWSHSFGDSTYQVPECVAVAASGKVVIAGRFQGSIDFGGLKIESQSNQTDIFVATFSSDGDCMWAKRFGGPYEQQTRSIAIDAAGSVALTGVFKGAISIDALTLSEQQPTDYCGFLAKLDEQGNALWCKRCGEPYVEQVSEVAFDRSSGDLLAAGFMRNKLPPDISREAGSVCLFARYDRSGVLRWSKAFPGAFADSIAVAPDGRILITGHFDKVVDFGNGPLVSAGGYDIFAAMFTPDGNALWSRRFGDRWQQFLVKGTHGCDDSIILAGSFHGTIDFGAGALIASGFDGTKEGAEDIFLAILENRDPTPTAPSYTTAESR